jgi:chromosome segregation ATPase
MTIQEKSAALDQANGQIAALQEERDLLTAAKTALETQLTDASARSEQVVGVYSGQIAALVLAADEAATNLRKKSDALDQSNAQIGSLQEQVSALSAAKTALEIGLQTRDSTLSTLQDQITGLQRSFEERTTRTNRLQAELDHLQSAKVEVENQLRQRETQLADQQATLQWQTAEFERTLATKTTEIAALTAGAVATTALIKELKTTGDVANMQLALLSEERDALTLTNTELQMRLEQFSAEVALLMTQMNEIQSALEGTQEEKALLEAGLRGQTADNTALNIRLYDLEGQLFVARAERDTLAVQVDAIPRDLLAVSLLTNRVVSKRAPLTAALIAGVQPALSPHPQNLSQIKGIDNAFAERLLAAGVGSFWEVANLTNADFERILELDESQRPTFHFADTRANALNLAQMTDTVGLIWEGQQIDDFDGISAVEAVDGADAIETIYE